MAQNWFEANKPAAAAVATPDAGKSWFAANAPKRPIGASGSWDAPQTGPTFTESLPAMIGGMAGGVTGAAKGAAMGAVLGPPGVAAGTVLGGLVGAGLGAFGGEGIRQATNATLGGQGTSAIDVPRMGQEATTNMVGEAVGGVAGPVVGRVASVVGPKVASATQRAAEFADSHGIPIDAATRTGSWAMTGIRGMVDRLPFVWKRGAAFKEGQQEGLGRAFTNIADSAPGALQRNFGDTSAVSAGRSLQGRIHTEIEQDAIRRTNELAARIEDAQRVGPSVGDLNMSDLAKRAKTQRAATLKKQTNEAYENYKAIANDPKNAAQIQTGTTEVVFDPITGVRSGGEPIYETIAAPVRVADAKQVLAPLFQKLTEMTPVAIRNSSPGYQALKGFMDMPDIVSSERALAELSAIQNLARSAFPEMRTVGEGLAAAVVPKLHEAIDATATALGPEAMAHLQLGRQLTKQRYDLFGTRLARSAANRAETSGNVFTNASQLDSILRQTDGAIRPQLARKHLDEMMTATTKDGQLDSAAFGGKWSKVSQDIKDLLYSPAEQQAVNRLADPVSSQISDEILHLAKQGEPEKLIQHLTQSHNKALNQLQAVAKIAPDELPNIGRSYLQGIIDDAQHSGWRVASFKNWKELGKETKQILFPAEQIKEIDQTFDLIKRIGTTANPSGTTPTLVGLGASGVFILPQVLQGDFEGIKNAAATAGGLILSGSVLARLLYSPAGAKLLRTGLVMNAAEPGAKNIARLLALEVQRAQRQEPQ